MNWRERARWYGRREEVRRKKGKEKKNVIKLISKIKKIIKSENEELLKNIGIT